VQTKKLSTMTFKEQEQITKNSSEELLTELINYQGENLMGEIVRLGIQQLMELDRDEHIGVGSYERGEDRRSQRNGYKSRQLYTRVGTLNLRVPQTRDGEFYPALLERYQRSEKALVLALAEAYIQGVSTRKMRMVTEQLMGREFSSTSISRFSARLDAELDHWRGRSLDRDFPYVVVDARYEHCRVHERVIDIAVLVAIGIDSDGYRHVLGLDTAWGETGDSWDRFISGLKERGLKGVRLFTSDDHPGIHPAIKKHFPGSVWQRCQFHFTRNAADLVPKTKREDLRDRLKEAWDQKTYKKAKEKLDKISEDYQDKYPDLAELISEHGWETLGVYDAAPVAHHKRLRTTNMLERINQELKRRSKVIRIFPNTSSCRRLFSALLKEWHEDWVDGRKYLDMESLWEFEKDKPNLQQFGGPAVDLSIVKEEKTTVV
jgi:putative transposase